MKARASANASNWQAARISLVSSSSFMVPDNSGPRQSNPRSPRQLAAAGGRREICILFAIFRMSCYRACYRPSRLLCAERGVELQGPV